MKEVITILILMAITVVICIVQNWWDGRRR